MIFHSVSEIFVVMDKTRNRIYTCVENLNQEQEHFRASAESWSIAGIVEHLSIVEMKLVELTEGLIKQAESMGKWNTRPDKGIGPVSLEEIVKVSKDKKYSAPEFVKPTGGARVRDSITKMRLSRKTLHDLQSRIEELDMAGLTYPHPIFGPIDLYQWLGVSGLHEYRHLGQIEFLMSLPEFNRPPVNS
jgi:uncharacterized damage-inducible protein DinB